MISFGKRLLALFFATLLFAIYYMFLGIIDDPALDSSTVETMFVFSFYIWRLRNLYLRTGSLLCNRPAFAFSSEPVETRDCIALLQFVWMDG